MQRFLICAVAHVEVLSGSLVAADGRWFALGLFSFFFGFFPRFLRFFFGKDVSVYLVLFRLFGWLLWLLAVAT